MPISKEKKAVYFKRMSEMLDSYTKVFIVSVDNVGSSQMNQTRLQMRGRAEILMGKNTMMRKVLGDFVEKNPGHHFADLDARMRGNVGFVFTNEDLGPIRDFILANRITNVVNLITAGTKVGSSEATLLNKLGIRPFSYGLKINEVCDEGNYFSPAVLDIDEAYLQAKFSMTFAKVAALSFATNTATQASVMHSVANAFKTVVAITVGLDNYTFPAAEKYK
eukprot:GSChrysophyteH2.ASY1.ANO1.174.1 assembled CDS